MEIAKSIEDLEPQAAVDNCAESTRKWHEKVLSYAHLVRRWTSYFWKINKAYLYSYEDLEQTIWYILMVGLQEFDGRGDEEQFLNWYIRNKIVSVIMYGKKPPKCVHSPFTPIRFDYVSPDDLAEVNELFYSDLDGE
ncbi:hypothetical protein MNL76_09510 [Fervidobacterium riparium]|uniref:Uncharacterized protein n=1 Tax=Fervidobacterium pennivorans (strain DSM 9078 / Ven5) TaxID=771875 RepID=H9UBG6_FERPD|nr:hypothetical protein [Fervidobacterium pennivorans]AFG34859.1 hypothetical protein Ferpe_0739 [Fervidobacterium pennivorans DSM 9078]